MRMRGVMALAAAVAIVVGACSSNGASTAPSSTAAASARGHRGRQRRGERGGVGGRSLPTELGSTQGQTINVLAWPGYVENGSTDKTVDWVTDFQTADRLHRQSPDLRHVG